MLPTLVNIFALASSLFLVVFLGVFLGTAQAGSDTYEPIYSIRQNGMGGVYVFHPKDASSFLQNPAYSCMTKGINWTLFDLNGAVNGLQVYSDVKSTSSLSGLSSFSSWYGKKIWFGLGGNSTMTLPCFGFSVYNASILTLLTHNPAFPNVEVTYLTDTGFSLGGGIPIGPNFSLGLAGKKVTRKGGTQNIGTSSLTTINNTTLLEQFANQGDGFGMDLGFVYRNGSAAGNPTVSASWRDVGSTAFIKSAGADAPERQKDNLVLGVSSSGEVPLLGYGLGLEYRHITESDMQIGKKIHLGLEVSLAFIDLRAGFYQGYTSYGAGLDFWFIHFDAAYYTVERGAYAGQTADQRVQLGLSFELGFDPDFKLTDSGGKKRKLKQRR